MNPDHAKRVLEHTEDVRAKIICRLNTIKNMVDKRIKWPALVDIHVKNTDPNALSVRALPMRETAGNFQK